MHDREWTTYFLVLPIFTMAILLLSLLYKEPFPTLLMPGFSGASDISQTESIQRRVFVVGPDDSNESLVTAFEFAQLDFTLSQGSPIINGIIRESPQRDPELDDWIHGRLERLLPSERCGEAVVLIVEDVAVTPDRNEFVRLETVESYDLGELRCD